MMSKITVLQMVNLKAGTGTYDWNYSLYVKESICLYHEIVERQFKLKRIINV